MPTLDPNGYALFAQVIPVFLLVVVLEQRFRPSLRAPRLVHYVHTGFVILLALAEYIALAGATGGPIGENASPFVWLITIVSGMWLVIWGTTSPPER